MKKKKKAKILKTTHREKKQQRGRTLHHQAKARKYVVQRNLTMQAIVLFLLSERASACPRSRDENEILFLLAFVTFLHCKSFDGWCTHNTHIYIELSLQQHIVCEKHHLWQLKVDVHCIKGSSLHFLLHFVFLAFPRSHVTK